MSDGTRLFLDTAFVLGLLNRADQHHADALRLAQRLDTADEVWTTEAVLIEIANGSSATNRAGAVRFIENLYGTQNARIEPLTPQLFQRGLALYRERADKEWGMTDCISFIVMSDHALADALTTDHHFVQAGFNAMLRRSGE